MKTLANRLLSAPHALLISSLIMASLLLPVLVKAESTPVPKYKVEVIVFEHYALKGWTEERWPEEVELPSTHKSTPLSSKGVSPLWMRSRTNQLNAVEQKMRNSYRVLFHQTWSQNAYKSKKSPTVLIENDRKGGSTFLGTVRLYKTRFAHIEIDLELEKRIPTKVREAFAQNQQTPLAELPSHWRFSLKEARKIKPGELHYIDHPLFGVLIQVHKEK
ncbi:MAG: hypothetical protein GXO35_00325 [Gammaproteobacteria bacterium]|nr:hypothetical protein [Gammaproteobacteria bacterium]